MESIQQLFHNRRWNKISSFPVEQVTKALSFEDNLRLAYRLLYNCQWDELLQEYAIELLYAVRDYYPLDWNSTWRNDALLGVACDVRFKYDERYDAFKRAFENVSVPPPELLIALAECHDCPGIPPVSSEQAIDLLKRAIEIHPYIDAVRLLHQIYWEMKDSSQAVYWKELGKEMELKDGSLSPPIEPQFLIDEYLAEQSQHDASEWNKLSLKNRKERWGQRSL